jgi:hypothetical protein
MYGNGNRIVISANELRFEADFRSIGGMRYRMTDSFFGLRVTGAVLLFALAPSLAWSYIDPGNGAYMAQLLFTLAGAALFYIRHPVRFFHALRNWVFRRNSSEWESLDGAAEVDGRLDSPSTEKARGRSD